MTLPDASVSLRLLNCKVLWGNGVISQRLLLGLAERLIRSGTIELTLPDGETRRFGDGSDPRNAIHIHDRRFFWRILRDPEIALGEAYMDGSLTVPDGGLKAALSVLARNANAGNMPPLQRLQRSIRRALRHFSSLNTRRASRRNAKAHYDLPVALYDLFMEEDKQYTCAYFRRGDETLEEAQSNKKHHIAAKLLLEPGMEVLEIGSGWGGLAITLARDYGVRVTGVTLSPVQLQDAKRRARAAGVTENIDFRLQDYREVTDRYDRVVAVGMMEHVGKPQYPVFFNKINDLLTDEGVAVLQFIGRSSAPDMTSPWMAKYIFPGGYTPSMSEVAPSVEASGLVMTDLEVWRGQYERTLQHWQARFEANIDAVRALVDEKFVRMWRYYLTAAEIGFSERQQVLYQMQLARQPYTVPSTRDYLYSEPLAAEPVASPDESGAKKSTANALT